MKFTGKEAFCVGIGLVIALSAGGIVAANSKKSKNTAANEKTTKAVLVKEEVNLVSKNEVPKELCLSEEASGVFFGKIPGKQPGYVGKAADKDGHILVVGSSGSGKTSAIANPTAKRWKGSTVTLLIKGNHEERVRQLEDDGRRVLVFDPASLEKNKVRYNPFLILDSFPEDVVDNAKSIADTLLPSPEKIIDPVWTNAAKAFLTGSILCFHSLGFTFTETMNIIFSQNVEDVIGIIIESGNANAIAFISKLSSVDNKLLRNTGFELVSLSGLLSPQILTALTEAPDRLTLNWSNFNQSSTPFDVVLLIPENRLDSWKPLLTLMLDQLIITLMARPDRTYDNHELPPLLLAIDEFPRLNKIPSIVNGLCTLRSRGITFLLLVQSIASLELLYGEKATAVILENCIYKVILCVSEPKGQKYFSDLIGQTSVSERSTSESISVGASLFANISIGSNTGETHAIRIRPLIYPQAFLILKAIVCITPYGVFQVEKAPCYSF